MEAKVVPMTNIYATYENGIFKPTGAVALEEGARVELTVVSYPLDKTGKSPAEILEAIANLPPEGDPNDEFSGAITTGFYTAEKAL